MTNEYLYLLGQTHTFPDGVQLRIVDIKQRSSEPWITFESVYPSCIPKRESKKAKEFVDTFGHLFQKS